MDPSPSKSPSSNNPSISSSFKLSPRFWPRKCHKPDNRMHPWYLKQHLSVWSWDCTGSLSVKTPSKRWWSKMQSWKLFYLSSNIILMVEPQSWELTWKRLQFERRNSSPSQSWSSTIMMIMIMVMLMVLNLLIMSSRSGSFRNPDTLGSIWMVRSWMSDEFAAKKEDPSVRKCNEALPTFLHIRTLYRAKVSEPFHH